MWCIYRRVAKRYDTIHDDKYDGICAWPIDSPPRARVVLHRPNTMFPSSSAYVVITFIVVAAIAFDTTNSEKVNSDIQCYVCNSHNDTECASEKLPVRFQMQCAKLNIGVSEENRKNYSLCRKIIQTIEPEVNGLPSDKNRIIRTCGWDDSNYNNKCYHRSGFGGKQDVCTCTTNYCNSAQNTYIAFATIMATSLAILIL